MYDPWRSTALVSVTRAFFALAFISAAVGVSSQAANGQNRNQFVPGGPGVSRVSPASRNAKTQQARTLSAPGAVPSSTCVTVAPGTTPAGGYLPLSAFGITPIAGMANDTILNFTVPAFTYGGVSYTQLGVDSNGYVVIGGGAAADNTATNQYFPNPAPPNNVLAPYWTDLDPSVAGGVRIGTLTDGSDTWIVVDWAGVPERTNAANVHNFEVWIGVDGDAHPGEDITYGYGTQTGNGQGGLLTVGAENSDGSRGATYYYNGTGTLPVNGTQLRVSTGTCTSACIGIGAGSSPAGGYLSLSSFGIAPIAGMGSDTLVNFNVPSYIFGGAGYSQLGVDSNGYVVLGGGTAADNSPVNQIFGNTTPPNNVLAPYWTDLDPSAGGAVRIGTLTDGSNTWIVVDWAGVPERTNLAKTHSFEVWIGVTADANPGEDVTYAYGPQSGNGEAGFLSVGAENPNGTHGATYYYNGTGTLPTNGTQLRVSTIACTPTAATVTVSGRVLTEDGSGLRNARVTMQDSAGNTRSAITSAFGYYSFSEVTLGTYVMGVSAKRFTFASRVVNVSDTLADMDFMANQP